MTCHNNYHVNYRNYDDKCPETPRAETLRSEGRGLRTYVTVIPDVVKGNTLNMIFVRKVQCLVQFIRMSEVLLKVTAHVSQSCMCLKGPGVGFVKN